MTEAEPKIANRGVISRVAEKVGLIPKPFVEIDADEVKAKVHLLSHHTNATLDEIEYMLGISKIDPHPDHPKTFSDCNHQKIVKI